MCFGFQISVVPERLVERGFHVDLLQYLLAICQRPGNVGIASKCWVLSLNHLEPWRAGMA